MFKRKALQRFNIYLGLFAILLISICPVITQTIALMRDVVRQQSISQHFPATTHFECAAEFLKTNGLNPDDFAENSLADHNSSNTSQKTSQNYDEHSLAKCGYCDLIHAATILTAFYIAVLETPSSEPVINNGADPYLFPLHYWSTLSRGPPSLSLA